MYMEPVARAHSRVRRKHTSSIVLALGQADVVPAPSPVRFQSCASGLRHELEARRLVPAQGPGLHPEFLTQ